MGSNASFYAKSGKFSQENCSLATKTVHSLLFAMSCIKNCQPACAFVMGFGGEDGLAATILAVLATCMCGTAIFWSYELFHRGGSETIILFNSLDFQHSESFQSKTEHVSHEDAGTEEPKRRLLGLGRLLRKMKSMSKQEILLVACPYLVNIFAPIYFGMMLLLPRWSVFMPSMMEPGTWLYFVSIVIELSAAFFVQANILFLFFFELAIQVVHLNALTLYDDKSAGTPGGTRGRGIEKVDESIGTFELYRLIVVLCNVLFPRILFTGKVMALTCSIFGTYFVIRYVHASSVIVSLFFVALTIQAIAFYVISCERIFHVPKAMRRIKDGCALVLQMERNGMSSLDWNARQRKIKAMPTEVAISDGGFRSIDSTSTLNFTDFYFNQVISLLLL